MTDDDHVRRDPASEAPSAALGTQAGQRADPGHRRATATSGAGGPSRRARKRAETRMALVEAAVAAFAADGYAATSVEEVADAAGVSPRTAFRYFPHKSDLVVDEHAAQLGRWPAEFAAVPTEEPLAGALRQASAAVAADLRHRQQFWERLRALLAGEPALAAATAHAEARARAGAVAAIATRTGLDDQDPRAHALAAAALSPLELTAAPGSVDGPALPSPERIGDVLAGLDGIADLLERRREVTSQGA